MYNGTKRYVFETVNKAFANVTSSLFQHPMAMIKLNLTSSVFMYISICVQGLNKFLKFF